MPSRFLPLNATMGSFGAIGSSAAVATPSENRHAKVNNRRSMMLSLGGERAPMIPAGLAPGYHRRFRGISGIALFLLREAAYYPLRRVVSATRSGATNRFA